MSNGTGDDARMEGDRAGAAPRRLVPSTEEALPVAHADNTPSDRPPSHGTPDHRPGQRSRLAIVVGIFVAVVVVALVVWFVLYVVAS